MTERTAPSIFSVFRNRPFALLWSGQFLIIPARVLRGLAKQYAGLNRVLFTTMTERLSQIEVPRSAGMDQQTLRLLRTNVVK